MQSTIDIKYGPNGEGYDEEALEQALDKHSNLPIYVFTHWALHIPPDELGRLFKEYFAESDHGGWEGFDRRDLTAIRKLLTDVIRFHRATISDDPNNFKKTNNVNPL